MTGLGLDLLLLRKHTTYQTTAISMVILQIINKQINSIKLTYHLTRHFLFDVFWHLIFEKWIESVLKIVICSLNVLMTVRYLKLWSILNNLRYCAIINWNFIWNIDLNNHIYCDFHNKSACLNTVLVRITN